jgi:MoxR-like ATPase
MEFNASSTSFNERVNLSEKILANMKAQQQSIGKSGILLAGDPGVGKTSFIKMFSVLTGINLITIEAPHITEEHIINIPFITFDPVSKRETNKAQGAEQKQFGDSDFKIVLSDSYLYSSIRAIKKIPDEEYLKMIYSSPKDIIRVFEELGGDKETIPEDISEVREKTEVILFLDEYFRQTSPKIRNMLRGILNGKIGSHDIPPTAYVIYASNINDEGVEDVPLNNDFNQIDFAAPEKDDWFSWLVSKFENDKDVKLDKRIVQKFYDILSSEDLNASDFAADVRTSPRRWEQIILYINSSLPAADYKEAKDLMTNISLNFKNYLTGKKAKIADVVQNAVAELIKETSNISISANEENGSEEWQDTLEHQIKQKMKIGNHRKYIPIISGAPGIGKTTHAIKIANDLGLRYIYIDCSNLNPEDVVGLPLPKTQSKSKIETQFSEPNLFYQINKDVKNADADHIAFLKHKYKGSEADEKVKEYEDSKWKYLIFFDELNRNSPKVFNGIRRLLLEKSFGGGYDLPDGSILMAAINPVDSGASELTSHMRDVVDVIDAKPDFTKTEKFLKNIPFSNIKNKQSSEVVLDVLNTFIKKFEVKQGVKESLRPFYLDVGGSPVYISPREYTDLYVNGVIDFDQKFNRLINKRDISVLDKDQLHETEVKLRMSLYETFKNKLSNIFTKQQTQAPEFLHDLKTWFLESDEIDFGEGLYYKKAGTVSIASILGEYFNNPRDDKNLADDMDFVGFVENHDPQKFKEELVNFFNEQFQKDEDVVEKLIKNQHRAKIVKDEQIDFEEKEVSNFEHVVREIINALEIHKISHDRREMVKQSISAALKKINSEVNSDFMDQLLTFNYGITKLIKGIKGTK